MTLWLLVGNSFDVDVDTESGVHYSATPFLTTP
jgi:hypothetical protein